MQMLDKAPRKMAKRLLCLLLLVAGKHSARANLLPKGTASASSIQLPRYDPSKAIDGKYAYDYCTSGCMFHSSKEFAPWFMVVLDEEILVKTIFFLERASNTYRRSQGARFLVGTETDPARLRDNAECPDGVRVITDRADSGYFNCGRWGNVLVMDLGDKTEVL